jgi:hypothetical protein
MELQTLTFELRGMTDRQAYHYVESLRLGVSELDGLAVDGRARRSVQGEWIVFCSWESADAVTAFRRSALYAKLAMSPSVENLRDGVERVVEAMDDSFAVAA